MTAPDSFSPPSDNLKGIGFILALGGDILSRGPLQESVKHFISYILVIFLGAVMKLLCINL